MRSMNISAFLNEGDALKVDVTKLQSEGGTDLGLCVSFYSTNPHMPELKLFTDETGLIKLKNNLLQAFEAYRR